jgi:hypothetical protein
MAEHKIRAQFPPQGGPIVDASDVPIQESTERWTDIHLEDGTHLRLKVNALSAVRIDGQWDAEGNPIYLLKSNQMMVLASTPEALRRPRQEGKVQ